MPVNPNAVGKVQVPFGASVPKETPAEESNPYLDEVRKIAKARLVGQPFLSGRDARRS